MVVGYFSISLYDFDMDNRVDLSHNRHELQQMSVKSSSIVVDAMDMSIAQMASVKKQTVMRRVMLDQGLQPDRTHAAEACLTVHHY